MDSVRLAWAAGFFEAEGSLSHHLPKGRRTPRATLDVSQKGSGSLPDVLVEFSQVASCGQIFGPYRGYLYYWRSHDVSIIASVLVSLWPWLSLEKRESMRKTLLAVPALWTVVPCGELLDSHAAPRRDAVSSRAWAAGFFEGDGTIGAYSSRRKSGGLALSASVAQASEFGVPSALERFRDVIGVGAIYGPIAPRGWSRLPQYRWQVRGADAQRLATVVLPFLAGTVKRSQVLAAIERCT